jgi:K+ transporter
VVGFVEGQKLAVASKRLDHRIFLPMILGVVSLILWSLILIISLKYALLILRADNRGEGGIVALLALLSVRNAVPGTWRAQLLIVGLIGAALLMVTAPSPRRSPF